MKSFVVFLAFNVLILKSLNEEDIWCENNFNPINSVWVSNNFVSTSNDNGCPDGNTCGYLHINNGDSYIYRTDGDATTLKDLTISFKWDLNTNDETYFIIQYICDESVSNWNLLSNYSANTNIMRTEHLNLPDMCSHKRNIGIRFNLVSSFERITLYLSDVCLRGIPSILQLSESEIIFCESDFSDLSDWNNDGDLVAVNGDNNCPNNDRCGRIDTGNSDPVANGTIWRYADGTGKHYIYLTFMCKSVLNYMTQEYIEVQAMCDGNDNWETFGSYYNVQTSSSSVEFRLPYYCRNNSNIGIRIIVHQNDGITYFNNVCLQGYNISNSSLTGVVTQTSEPTEEPSTIPTQVPSLSPTMNPIIDQTIFPTINPSIAPTLLPTQLPTVSPSVNPSMFPSINPSSKQTTHPTITPTYLPSHTPTNIDIPLNVNESQDSRSKLSGWVITLFIVTGLLTTTLSILCIYFMYTIYKSSIHDSIETKTKESINMPPKISADTNNTLTFPANIVALPGESDIDIVYDDDSYTEQMYTNTDHTTTHGNVTITENDYVNTPM